MKKITLLISSLAGGGAEGVCVNIANALVVRGWEVNLVVLSIATETYLKRVDKRVKVVVLNVNNARYAPPKLLRYFIDNGTDKVIVFNYELAVITIILRIFFRLKLKVIARNINTLSKINNASVSIWQRFFVVPLINIFYKRADHIVNQCDAMKNDLLSIYPSLIDKTSVIYNPVAKHIEDYAKSRDVNFEKKGGYILCVGRLERQKAFHHAIDAFSKIKNDFPCLRLKFVGVGKLEGELKDLARELNVSDRVDFEGFKSDIIDYYINAELTLLTSLYEGFPNVLIESITLGTPVVSFDCQSGPREIINRSNGILVENGNVESLVKAITEALEMKLSSINVNETADRYRIDCVISEWERLIYNVQ